MPEIVSKQWQLICTLLAYAMKGDIAQSLVSVEHIPCNQLTKESCVVAVFNTMKSFNYC